MWLTLQGFVLIVGLFMFVLSTREPIREIGRIMFFCALLAMMFGAESAIKLLRS